MTTTVTFIISGDFLPRELYGALGISDTGAEVLMREGGCELIYKRSFIHTEAPDECISDMLYETLLPLVPREDRLGEIKESFHIRYSLDIDTIPPDTLLILDGKISGFFSRSGAIREIDYYIF